MIKVLSDKAEVEAEKLCKSKNPASREWEKMAYTHGTFKGMVFSIYSYLSPSAKKEFDELAESVLRHY